MPQDVTRPKDDGQIRMPPVSSSMNKISPPFKMDDKGTMLGAPKGDKKEKQKLLERVRKRMDRAIAAESDNRKAGMDDRSFVAGNQWPSEVVAQRNLDKRPCLTFNKFPTLISQVTNAQRQSRPSINISPTGEHGDAEVAKMYRGMIRFIERDCGANSPNGPYDTAFADAVTMGWGYWRVLTEWESPDSFNLVLVVRRIRNPFTVYLDPSHQEIDGSDARWGFVSELMPRDEFKEKYPKADQMQFTQAGLGETMKQWITTDEIRIAEYFEIEYKTRTLVELSNGHTGWEDELDDITDGYIRRGKLWVTDEREARVPKVMWYKVSANDVLMEREWLGSTIPIVKVTGRELDIEGRPKLKGIVRDAKDAQRMINYWDPLALDTPIPTPTGWTTMGETEAGDWVLDENGKPALVLGTSPVHLFRDCFRVDFDDGSHIIADAAHPWQVDERGKRMTDGYQWQTKLVQTADLTPKKHVIRAAAPLDLPDVDLPIDPYLLGVWLGDGLTSGTVIFAGDRDIDEIRANLADVGCNVGVTRNSPDRVGMFTIHGVRRQFTAIGLLGNKHIPPEYLRASKAQREALLQGLMDTDGSIQTKTRQCSFTTTLPRLSADFAELLRTLGIKAVSIRRAGGVKLMLNSYTSEYQESDQFSFSAPPDANIFRLRRKASIQNAPRSAHPRRTKRHRIVGVTPVPSVPVKCIMVDTPTHLFLAGPGMVPTHNTSKTEMVALAPKSPYIGEEGQFEGHEDEWKMSNVRSTPYLSYKGTSVNGTPAPPPQRVPFAGVPAGIVEASQSAQQHLMGITGVRFDSTVQERTMDESGKALRELRQSGDIGSFDFIDNLTQSLRRTGEIFLELIPKIYSDARVITILREDDKEEQVKIDPTMKKPMGEMQTPDGKKMKLFNPISGKYGVTVTIGPNYATKRVEAGENMIAFAKALPQTAALIADLIAKNMDWPGAEEIAARLAKTLPPNLLMPDHKDLPPQAQALLSAMDQQIKQLGQQLQQAMQALTDKNADRALIADRTNKDFEAKLLKIVSDTETKMAATEERATSNFNTHIGAQIKDLGAQTAGLMQALEHPPQAAEPEAGEAATAAAAGSGPTAATGGDGSNPAPTSDEATPPPEALRHLKPGRNTTFGNGQTWTMGKDGKPQRVAGNG
jgi:Phage P22-like portal protein/LAGLIDADG-like domain